MLGIKVEGTGFSDAHDFLKNMKLSILLNKLEKYGQMGVEALSEATPKRTGLTANSWGYKIEQQDNNVRLIWTNSNVNNGVAIAFIIQHGHGTGTGGFVQGIDYINPAMEPVIDKISDKLREEIARL